MINILSFFITWHFQNMIKKIPCLWPVWTGNCKIPKLTLHVPRLKMTRLKVFGRTWCILIGSHIYVSCITFTLSMENYVLWFLQMKLWLFMVLAFTVCLHLYFLHQYFARLTIRKTSKYYRYVTCWSIHHKKRIVLWGRPHTAKVSIHNEYSMYTVPEGVCMVW